MALYKSTFIYLLNYKGPLSGGREERTGKTEKIEEKGRLGNGKSIQRGEKGE